MVYIIVIRNAIIKKVVISFVILISRLILKILVTQIVNECKRAVNGNFIEIN